MILIECYFFVFLYSC